MKAKELLNIGYEQGRIIGVALKAAQNAKAHGMGSEAIREAFRNLFDNPESFFDHPQLGVVARELDADNKPPYVFKTPDEARRSYNVWGEDYIDENTHDQMRNAIELPISVGGALMPDAHLGYGLPIGGVLATDGVVIPHFVGVDIACRMKVTVLPIQVTDDDPDPIVRMEKELIDVIERNTRFGAGCAFYGSERRNAAVMDEDWNDVSHFVSQLKDLAWEQLGTSGGGNHFVDIGIIEFTEPYRGLEPGKYVAMLTHSGSRGPGNKIATYYCKLARKLHPHLPKQYQHSAWLPMDGDGAEYWAAMELMGRFASANHNCIHEAILKGLKMDPLLQTENHHNFAWKEIHGGKELIVHRKGATPASEGEEGIIPGSMATPGFLVLGKGNAASYNSASHGAGRAMSRRAAKDKYAWHSVKEYLRHKNVKLITGGLDECPMAYKDIHQVMNAQTDLVTIKARFDPRLVKMADDGYVED